MHTPNADHARISMRLVGAMLPVVALVVAAWLVGLSRPAARRSEIASNPSHIPIAPTESMFPDLPALATESEERLDETSSSVTRTPRNDDESALVKSLLAGSREIDLDSKPGAGMVFFLVARLHAKDMERLRKAKLPTPSLSEPIERLLATRNDLNGLPLLAGDACLSSKEQVTSLVDVSMRVRRIQGSSGGFAFQSVSANLRDYLEATGNRFEATEDRSLLVRPLEQMMQVEGADVRVELVWALSKIAGNEATLALARRAVFDLNPRVRESAIEALLLRDARAAREVFLSAFRHPWAPAADHAALALATLGDEDVAPRLRELLHESAPTLPYKDSEGKWTRKELVRVNHLRNCLLCHPPSVNLNDEITGAVPTPGESLDAVMYYSPAPRIMVRADVVYFRQDFSAMHTVVDPQKWPAHQRFDYLVQVREVSAAEAEAALTTDNAKTYRQREAVRWTLAKLGDGRSRR